LSVPIPLDDPAATLWNRCLPADLAIFGDLLNTPPIPAGRIAAELGIRVVSKTLDSEISGLIRQENNRYVIEVNNTDAGVRQRFTVCHEIAHYLLHRQFIDSSGITDTILYRSKLSNRQEAEANKLAAAILLPWKLVNEWHQHTFGCSPIADNIDSIARQFRVSRLAVGFRFGF